MSAEVRSNIRQSALYNAIQHDGRAKVGPVLGKVLAEHPELKGDIKLVHKLVTSIVEEVNSLTVEKQRQMLEEKWPSLLKEKRIKSDEVTPLSPLPSVEKFQLIHLRFCPNPDGALHLGGCRAAILDDEYVKMHRGCLTLRFDDTDPRTKSPILEAYDWIRDDLEWLGIKWHREVYQSDRVEVYYSYIKQLIELNVSYVCTCKPTTFRKLILVNRSCPCRDLPPNDHLYRWNHMLDEGYKEGEAVVRIKTDLYHPNPAVRDWPAMRIINVKKYPHPRVKDKYRVWPLFAFCCGIDDHDLEISHILRGKEHLTTFERGRFLYRYLGWTLPEAIHYGRLRITGTVLSKSKIREGIIKGTYFGWDDPRLGTIKALRKRGFLPDTVRRFIRDLGPKAVDVNISWKNIESTNRKLLDPFVNRYSFVANPIELRIENVKKCYVFEQRLHPEYPERGHRIYEVSPRKGIISIWVSKDDLSLLTKGRVIRLIGLFNVKVKRTFKKRITADFFSETYLEAKELGAPLIHWILHPTGIKTSIVMSDANVVEGLAEEQSTKLKRNDIIQFERFGFVRIDQANPDHIQAYYAHR